jgi:hypothetical protein
MPRLQQHLALYTIVLHYSIYTGIANVCVRSQEHASAMHNLRLKCKIKMDANTAAFYDITGDMKKPMLV